MFSRADLIAGFDPELAKAIADEDRRQEDHVELIASENYASPRVWGPGQPAHHSTRRLSRPALYGGCEYVDVAERLAIERCRQLFGADYANVQPHSGSQANQAVYFALLQPGDTILGMSLAHGGHLTHGAKVNLSGKLFNAVQYGVNEAGLIDYDEVERLALEHKPKMVVAGFSAYSQVVDWARFRAIADKVGAYLFVDMAHVAGLIAAGVYPSPVPHAHVVTSTTHKTLRGPRGGIIVASKAGMGAADEIEKSFVDRVPGIRGASDAVIAPRRWPSGSLDPVRLPSRCEERSGDGEHDIARATRSSPGPRPPVGRMIARGQRRSRTGAGRAISRSTRFRAHDPPSRSSPLMRSHPGRHHPRTGGGCVGGRMDVRRVDNPAD